jgi:uncharacterized protein YbbC (DUF1343 family)
MHRLWIILLNILIFGSCSAQPATKGKFRFINPGDIKTGAQRTEIYFPWLQEKKIAVVANQTSMIGDVHLVDSLVGAGFTLVKVFSPEHGFRGNSEAGEEIENGRDTATDMEIVSLYGKHLKPTKEDLKDIQIVIYDIQDVGARFFTYISTLTYVMEACAESGIPVIILDRPDPNGFYVDGPVLDTAYASFVGLHPVPIVYGMTAGEYSMMVNGEGWLKGHIACDLKVVPVEGYEHSMICKLPVRPSPNLPDWQSVYLYPSLCLFEGTVVSVGRGTDKPFRVIGHPHFWPGSYIFVPKNIPGISSNPPYLGQNCTGQDLTGYADHILENQHHFTISFLMDYYKVLSKNIEFFNSYFDNLAGGSGLRQMIIEGKTEEEIRKSWEPALERFKEKRKKYLLYPE